MRFQCLRVLSTVRGCYECPFVVAALIISVYLKSLMANFSWEGFWFRASCGDVRHSGARTVLRSSCTCRKSEVMSLYTHLNCLWLWIFETWNFHVQEAVVDRHFHESFHAYIDFWDEGGQIRGVSRFHVPCGDIFANTSEEIAYVGESMLLLSNFSKVEESRTISRICLLKPLTCSDFLNYALLYSATSAIYHFCWCRILLIYHSLLVHPLCTSWPYACRFRSL